MQIYDVIVIGGGPAGMLSSIISAKRGKTTLLIEKNNILGKKLLITGKGRCNVTNSAPIEDFILNTRVNPNFMYSAFYSFTNDDLIKMLSDEGLELKEERGGRIFPVSDSSWDVKNTLEKLLNKNKVSIKNEKVTFVDKKDDVFFVKTQDDLYYAQKVIIATGGVSYPKTGSTGDGYKFAKNFNHSIVTPTASLVPLVTKEDFIKDLMGLSLKNIGITLYKNDKKIYEDFGEMIFTHFGLSGPVILSASSHMKEDGEYKLKIDLKPALDVKTLDKRILRDFENEKNKDFINSLDALLPKKLIPVIVGLTGIDEREKVHSITKEQRQKLVNLLKEFTLTIISKRPIDEAIITSGGVNVKEIDPSTMESKLVKGLYFAGEVIDVDAYTGGYNLQIAFSTAYLAGINV